MATVFTWPLLFVGGLVTTYKVGMAVPDWPTTFGINMFLYDMTQASWAVFGEHTHRLYGAAVGFFTILLMLDFWIFDRRSWIKGLGVIALLAVIAQGLLGGMRVRWNSTQFAAFHGCFGQAFFGFMVALCVVTGRAGSARPEGGDRRRKYRGMAASGLFLVSLQVIVGAWLRHFPTLGPWSSTRSWPLPRLRPPLGLGDPDQPRRRDVPELVPASRALGILLLACKSRSGSVPGGCSGRMMGRLDR